MSKVRGPLKRERRLSFRPKGETLRRYTHRTASAKAATGRFLPPVGMTTKRRTDNHNEPNDRTIGMAQNPVISTAGRNLARVIVAAQLPPRRDGAKILPSVGTTMKRRPLRTERQDFIGMTQNLSFRPQGEILSGYIEAAPLRRGGSTKIPPFGRNDSRRDSTAMDGRAFRFVPAPVARRANTPTHKVAAQRAYPHPKPQVQN